MIAMDNDKSYWCVGIESNVGKSDGTKWVDQPKMNEWKLRMLAFDKWGIIWCVGTEYNIGKWDPKQEKWKRICVASRFDSIARRSSCSITNLLDF